MGIINLTQHTATADQVAEGVVELPEEFAKAVRELLTFNELPTREVLVVRANLIAEVAEFLGHKQAMIGGAPYLMPLLEEALKLRGVQPMYAFSTRKSIEETIGGEVIKRTVFAHLGFVH